jgi:hypothetical protein
VCAKSGKGYLVKIVEEAQEQVTCGDGRAGLWTEPRVSDAELGPLAAWRLSQITGGGFFGEPWVTAAAPL